MNIVLWVLQVLVGLVFVLNGAYTHGFGAAQAKSRPGMQWIGAIPQPLLTFIAICEFLGGVGLILPAATGTLPWLTPLAAGLLAVVMLLAAGYHFVRREYPNIAFNLVLLALAAFLAYGRFVAVPL